MMKGVSEALAAVYEDILPSRIGDLSMVRFIKLYEGSSNDTIPWMVDFRFES